MKSLRWAFGVVIVGVLWVQSVSAEIPACYRKVEESFFDPTFVTQALAMHRYIFQSTWSEINRDLQTNAKKIHGMVQERAAKMKPNPFGPPFQPQAVAQLLEQVQIEVLTITLAKYAVKNSDQVRDIYNYIRERQKAMWEECFGVSLQENR